MISLILTLLSIVIQLARFVVVTVYKALVFVLKLTLRLLKILFKILWKLLPLIIAAAILALLISYFFTSRSSARVAESGREVHSGSARFLWQFPPS